MTETPHMQENTRRKQGGTENLGNEDINKGGRRIVGSHDSLIFGVSGSISARSLASSGVESATTYDMRGSESCAASAAYIKLRIEHQKLQYRQI